MAGGGNKHAQFYSPGHQNSLIHLCARAFFSHCNEGLPFTSRIQVPFFDNNFFVTGNSAQDPDGECPPYTPHYKQQYNATGVLEDTMKDATDDCITSVSMGRIRRSSNSC